MLRERGSLPPSHLSEKNKTSLLSSALDFFFFLTWMRYVQYCASTDYTCDQLSCAPILSCSQPASSTVSRYHAHKSREHIMSMAGCVFKKNSTSNKLKRCNRWESDEAAAENLVAVWTVIHSEHSRSMQACLWASPLSWEGELLVRGHAKGAESCTICRMPSTC